MTENTYSKLTDTQLISLAKKRDNRAFEAIVRRYEKNVYNLALRIVNNPTVASDILQETFIKVYRSLSTFRGTAKFSTWLYRIAFNFCLMHKRKKNYTVSLDNPVVSEQDDDMMREIPDWSDDPQATAENSDVRRRIDKALNKLPHDYRSVVIFRDVQGFSNRETAKILNISVPAVKSRVHRARMFLRDNLSHYFEKARKEATR